MSGTTGGFGYFLKGLSLISKPGVKRFVIIPLIINILTFMLLIAVAGSYVSNLVNEYIPEFDGWLSFINIFLEIVSYVLVAIVVFYTSSFVANVLASPFNGPLAAAVEKHLTNQTPPGSDRNIMGEIGFTMVNELKKWLYYFMWAIPLAIISLILLVIFAPLVGVIWFIFGAWMFSLEYSDYPMGNYGMSFKDIRAEVAKKRMMSLGFGSAVTLGTMIPLFNFMVMPVAVAGATAMRVEQYPLQLEQK